MANVYYRPIVQSDPCKPNTAMSLVGGSLWFAFSERITRDGPSEIVPIAEVPDTVLARLTASRPPLCGVDMQHPSIMGILNVTPDSFSDGGINFTLDDALNGACNTIAEGADIVDIGGESTRPGAEFVEAEEEARRTAPVVAALRTAGVDTPVSVDTRKASVARAAFEAGADLFNDVTGMTYDPDSLTTAAELGAGVCIMHSVGEPKTMQDNPQYDNVLLDVYDHLRARIEACEAVGIPRAEIMVDPGIGFAKTHAHNLALLRRISIFHGLGCPILLGVSRKGFIGAIGDAPEAADRLPGSLAVELDALNQGVQMLRVHDIAATKQAIALWSALQDED